MNINFLKKIFKNKFIKIKGFKNIKIKKKIIIKYGIDPTYHKLHLGHLFILKKIKKLLNYKNFKVFIIIGSYTALLGDTSRIKKRNILKNNKIYYNSIFITNFLKKFFLNKVYILNNYNWFNNLNFGFIKDINLVKLLKRKEIKKKLKKKKRIRLGEVVYPFFQSYDNYITNCNIELGGEDQEFNMFYNKKFKKCNIIFKLIPGIDGLKKMSSSKKNNCIFINESSDKIFWKILKIKDFLINKFEFFFKKNKKNKKYCSENKLNKKLNLFYKINKFVGNKDSKKIISDFIKKENNKINIKFKIKLPCNLITLLSKIFKKSKIFFKKLIKEKIIYLNGILINNFSYIQKNKNFFIKIGKKNYTIDIINV
ncbi:tyrosine--tRNA ligase [Candidatus Vidania fulgoroideorum]